MKKTLNGWKKLKIMFLEKSGTNRSFFRLLNKLPAVPVV